MGALVCCAVGEMFCWSLVQAEIEAGRGVDGEYEARGG